jgi:hypothetical protein
LDGPATEWAGGALLGTYFAGFAGPKFPIMVVMESTYKGSKKKEAEK